MDKENTSTAKDDIYSIVEHFNVGINFPTNFFSHNFTYTDAIKILREHNLTGKPVVQLTNGVTYERPLMLEFLDECERKLEQLQKLKLYLQKALEDMHIADMCDVCATRISESPLQCDDCDNCFKWRYKDAVESLLKEDFND